MPRERRTKRALGNFRSKTAAAQDPRYGDSAGLASNSDAQKAIKKFATEAARAAIDARASKLESSAKVATASAARSATHEKRDADSAIPTARTAKK